MSEVINARLDDGAWRSVPPVKKHTLSADALFVHVLDDRENFIFWEENNLSVGYMDPAGVTYPIFDAVSTDFIFTQYKNILIVSSVTDMYRKYCIWDATDETYLVIDTSEINLDIQLYTELTATPLVACSGMSDHETNLTTAKKKGEFYGQVLIVYAFETIYGEIIKHSRPIYAYIGAGWWGDPYNGNYNFYKGFVMARILNNARNNAFMLKKTLFGKIIKSVNFYMTDPLHDTVLKEDNDLEKLNIDYFYGEQVFLELYKYDFKSLVENNTSVYTDFKLLMNSNLQFDTVTPSYQYPGDVTDMATRDEMPVDNFSHHAFVANHNHIYNNRLLLADVSTSLRDPETAEMFTYPTDKCGGGVSIGTHSLKLEITLQSSSGEKITLCDYANVDVISHNATSQVAWLPVITYPDNRAIRVRIIEDWLGALTYFNCPLAGLEMKAHALHNYSFVCASSGNPFIPYGGVEFASLKGVTINWKGGTSAGPVVDNTKDNIIKDPNRVQASAVDNVFYFPALNSYQVGNSRVLAISENAMPVSTGQFGSYPLIAFTESGIWAMNVDPSGAMFVTSITPISDDRLSSAGSLTKAGNIILFASSKGIGAMAGQDIQYISQLIDGLDFKTKIYSNAHFNTIATGANFGTFFSLLTTTKLSSYIGGMTGIGGTTACIMGFDPIENELIISNPSFAYSWIYSFKHQVWTKSSVVYRRFLYGRSRTYALRNGSNQLYILGEVSATTYTGVYATDFAAEPELFRPMVFISQPFQGEAADIYTKIEQLFADGSGIVASGKSLGIFLFSSVDGESWYMNSAVDILGTSTELKWRNIQTQRSGFSAKYHILMICGPMGDVYISPEMEISFSEKYTRKSR